MHIKKLYWLIVFILNVTNCFSQPDDIIIEYDTINLYTSGSINEVIYYHDYYYIYMRTGKEAPYKLNRLFQCSNDFKNITELNLGNKLKSRYNRIRRISIINDSLFFVNNWDTIYYLNEKKNALEYYNRKSIPLYIDDDFEIINKPFREAGSTTYFKDLQTDEYYYLHTGFIKSIYRFNNDYYILSNELRQPEKIQVIKDPKILTKLLPNEELKYKKMKKDSSNNFFVTKEYFHIGSITEYQNTLFTIYEKNNTCYFGKIIDNKVEPICSFDGIKRLDKFNVITFTQTPQILYFISNDDCGGIIIVEKNNLKFITIRKDE